MANGKDTRSCATSSWIVAAFAGLLLMALLMVLGDWRFIQAAFAGVIAAIILGFLMTFFMCPEGTAKSDLEDVRNGNKGAAAAGAGAAAAVAGTAAGAASAAAGAGARVADAGAGAADAGGATADAASGAATASAAAAAGGAATASKAFEMQPSKALAGEAELAARKGEWKYEGEADKPKKAAPKKAAAKKPAAEAKPKRAPVAADGKPETLEAPRAGGADNLKLISGVGPKLEGMLNKMGFWHFEQVASWRKKEVQWVNDNLEGFKGRVERDDWVSQAKILAKGGETEFSKRKKK